MTVYCSTLFPGVLSCLVWNGQYTTSIPHLSKERVIDMLQVSDICPAVAVIIFDPNKEKVLLQKRADVKLWGLISGHVEPGESITSAAVREVREETGLSARITRMIGVYSDPESQIFKYPNGTTTHFVTTYFEAEVDAGPLSCCSPETLDLRYFTIDHLPEDLLPMNPHWLSDALSLQEKAFVR